MAYLPYTCMRMHRYLNAVLYSVHSIVQYSGKFEPLQLQHAQNILGGFEVEQLWHVHKQLYWYLKLLSMFLPQSYKNIRLYCNKFLGGTCNSL